MTLNAAQQQVLEEWMRSKAIVMCPACGQDKWRFAEAAYLRALLEKGTEDLVEAAGVIKVPCDNCGYLALFDAETLGIRGLWAEGRELQHPKGGGYRPWRSAGSGGPNDPSTGRRASENPPTSRKVGG